MIFARVFEDMYIILWYLYQILGLTWIIHTIITGVSICVDVPYKKVAIPVGVPSVIFSCFYLERAGLFSHITLWFQKFQTSYPLTDFPFHVLLLIPCLLLVVFAMRREQ
jgi:hypothetical protein